ncbi:MAG: thioredoxin domain-containing protein [Acidobacteriota bacterium]|nr:MAG: thioredoxin domain-containing protein [Acidobacteriota bacterium]
MEEAYVETGILRYVLADMPLRMHKLAFAAAQATHCARDQGAYWEMHDRLFENQKSLEPWAGHAESLGLDVAKFEECMSSNPHKAYLDGTLALAQKAGFSGTPSFLLGITDPDDPSSFKGFSILVGAQPIARFQQQIEAALKTLPEETE